MEMQGRTNDRLPFKFGIEIECFGCTRTAIKDELIKHCINADIQTYNHVTVEGQWKITLDGSVTSDGTDLIMDLHGNMVMKGIEVVSPPLYGVEGLKELHTVLDVLNKLGAKVDKSCGLHIHLDSTHLTTNNTKNILVMYYNNQQLIDKLIHSDRAAGSSKFCQAIEKEQLEKVRGAATKEMIGIYMRTRHKVVNARAYRRHVNTIEFRQHHGSLDYDEIVNWLTFLQMMLVYCVSLGDNVLKISDNQDVKEQFITLNKQLRLHKDMRMFSYIVKHIRG